MKRCSGHSVYRGHARHGVDERVAGVQRQKVVSDTACGSHHDSKPAIPASTARERSLEVDEPLRE